MLKVGDIVPLDRFSGLNLLPLAQAKKGDLIIRDRYGLHENQIEVGTVCIFKFEEENSPWFWIAEPKDNCYHKADFKLLLDIKVINLAKVYNEK